MIDSKTLRAIIILSVILSAGCATKIQPVAPDVPPNLLTQCRAGMKLNANADMGNLLEVAIENNFRLAECIQKHEALIDACD